MLLPPGQCYIRRLALHAGVAWIPYIWDSTLVGINTPLQAMPSAVNSKMNAQKNYFLFLSFSNLSMFVVVFSFKF